MASSDGANLNSIAATTGITESVEFDLRFLRNGTTSTFYTRPSGSDTWTQLGGAVADTVAPYDAGHTTFRIGAVDGIGYEGVQNFYCKGITIYNGGATVLDIDFTNPSDAHGATSITAETGQTVTINQSGNNPATLIRYPVARFDGSDDLMLIDLGSAVAQPFTIFMVAQAHAAPASPNGRLIHGSSASGTEADVLLIGANPDTSPDEFFINMGENEKLSDFDTDLHIFSVVANGASSTARQDGSDLGISVSASGSNGLGQYVSLFGRYHDGARCIAADLHACLIFDRALTTAEQEKLENYYNARLAVF